MKTKEEIDAILLGLHQSGNYPAYDANLLADVLMDEFQKKWQAMPESTYQVLLGVAACLKQHHFNRLSNGANLISEGK